MYRCILTFIVILMVAGPLDLIAAPSVDGYFEMKYEKKEDEDPKYEQHSLNLILSHGIGKFSFFGEIEYQGGLEAKFKDDAVESAEGAIAVERGWFQYSPNTHLNLRTGKMIAPNLYHTDHYPNVRLNVVRPQIVAKNIFHMTYTGVKFFGEMMFGLNYDIAFFRDPEKGTKKNSKRGRHLALGYNRSMGDLDLALKYHIAKYYEWDSIALTVEGEESTGIELKLNYKNITLWAEQAKRKNETATQHSGLYTILSYEFDLGDYGELAPYLVYDSYKADPTYSDKLVRTGLGLNYHPDMRISIKAEYLKGGDAKLKDGSIVYAQDQINISCAYFF